MDWRDAVTIALAGGLGMVGGVFGPAGIVGGVVLGAALGARWGARADRIAALDSQESESSADDGT